MRIAERIFPTPRTIVPGAVGTGWLGFVGAWVVAGYGAVLTAVSTGGAMSVEEGACASLSDLVCGVANLGGVVAGAFALLVASIFSVWVARGFGTPLHWWMLPMLASTASAALFIASAAGRDAVRTPPLVASLAFAIVALVAVVLVMSRRPHALLGWIRLDGLDARETRFRGVDAVLPVAAVLAAIAGGAFAVHTAGLLAAG